MALRCPELVLTNDLFPDIVGHDHSYVTLNTMMYSLSVALGTAASFGKCYQICLFQMAD